MSGIVGSCFAFSGFVQTLNVMSQGPEILKKDLNGVPNTACNRICRIAANLFKIIGLFCGAVGMLCMGGMLLSLSPEIAFLPGFNLAMFTALPYFISSMAALSADLVIRQVVQ